MKEISIKLNELLCFLDSIGVLRPIVVIGYHLAPNDKQSDIACLNKLINPLIISPIIDCLDTEDGKIVLALICYNPDPEPTKFAAPSLRKILE